MGAQVVFLAGASGAIGKRLVPQLIEAGHKVFGSTRSSAKAAQLEELGAIPVVVDVFDRSKLVSALRAARPSVVMNQLTDLPKTWSGSLSEETLKANARLRIDGTRNLMAAAISAGARRFISQSLGWLYAPGPQPHRENDPLDRNPDGPAAASIAGVMALEQLTLGSPPLEGLVLRYGQFYGPGTWNTAQSGPLPVHIDAAAHAALLAVETRHLGVFNIAEENGLVSSEKARRELGWSADFRLQSPVTA
jgi:nucleoside-diphosphate-sugar epimerase